MTPDALAALHAACFVTPRPWSAGEFETILARPGSFLVTEPNGFALGQHTGPEAELMTIAVAPAARRQGTANRLMGAFMNRLEGVEEVFLEVAQTNSPAIALYSAWGFVDAGHRKNYYKAPNGERITALVMRKTLI